MADIHIRRVDDSLLRSLKLAALQDGVSLKDLVVSILEAAVKPKEAPEPVPQP